MIAAMRGVPWLTAALMAWALLAAGPAPAAAHDFCLLPESARANPGDPVLIAMHVSEVFPGEVVPWRTGRVVDFFVADSKGRWDVTDPPLEGDPSRARIRLRGAGTAIIALTTEASYIELPGAEFEAYLRHEGHTQAIDQRRAAGRSDAPGRERYTRHVKTIVNAVGTHASVALTRAGLTLEIVPETDLSRLKAGDKLPVRLFYRDAPFIEGQVCATWAGRQADKTDNPASTKADDAGHDDYAWCGRADGAGRALVPIQAAGWQMIRTSRMIPLRDDPKADWHSYWSSLTFEVEGKTPGAAAPGND